MGKLILILGGARSGKSAFAEELAKGHKRVVYIATAVVGDGEMRRRVAHHRKRRPKHWGTLEASDRLDAAIRKVAKTATMILVDCVTLYLTNALLGSPMKDRRHAERGTHLLTSSGGASPFPHEDVLKEIERICEAAKSAAGTVVMVSNEVGMGIVPDTPLGREFRDLQGRANQLIACAADEVYLVVAGIPQKIK